MAVNQYGMMVHGLEATQAETGSTTPQVVHFGQSLHLDRKQKVGMWLNDDSTNGSKGQQPIMRGSREHREGNKESKRRSKRSDKDRRDSETEKVQTQSQAAASASASASAALSPEDILFMDFGISENEQVANKHKEQDGTRERRRDAKKEKKQKKRKRSARYETALQLEQISEEATVNV